MSFLASRTLRLHSLRPETSAHLADRGGEDVRWFQLVLRDGSRLVGTIVKEDDEQVVLRNESGTIVAARREDIASLKEITGEVVDGRFVPRDPNATRLFFGPTGRSLARGQTYLGVYEFLMPFVQVGITDRFSIGGGTPLVFGFNESERPFWVTPKLQLVNRARTQVAVGTFHVFNTGGDGGGIAYAVGTHGGGSSSFTIGGRRHATGTAAATGVLMVGGEQQVRHNLKLITENYLEGWRRHRVGGRALLRRSPLGGSRDCHSHRPRSVRRVPGSQFCLRLLKRAPGSCRVPVRHDCVRAHGSTIGRVRKRESGVTSGA